MTSYIWRSSSGQQHATTKQGTRAAATTDVIQFDSVNVTDGKHIHQTELDIVVAIGDNEKPQGNVNELLVTCPVTINFGKVIVTTLPIRV